MNVLTDIVVRPMRWWDIAGVHDLEAEAFPDTAWSAETFWSELAGVPETRCYFVARSDDRVAGYAGLMTVGSDADVQTIAVAPQFRHRGLGARLLDELLLEATRRGCSRATLEVAASSDDAQRLYRRRGFAVVGRRSGYYGPGVDALIMRLRLPGGREAGGASP